MRRHGPMVLRVCRRALGNAQDAEDVFQATFLLLSRKAGSLRDRAGVGPWLFGVASRLARKARTAACRRAAHEARAPSRPTGSADPSLAETQALLDEELALLPEKYRCVLILCYLQGLTRDEAAGRLGLSLAGVKKRLERGREILQHSPGAARHSALCGPARSAPRWGWPRRRPSPARRGHGRRSPGPGAGEVPGRPRRRRRGTHTVSRRFDDHVSQQIEAHRGGGPGGVADGALRWDGLPDGGRCPGTGNTGRAHSGPPARAPSATR